MKRDGKTRGARRSPAQDQVRFAGQRRRDRRGLLATTALQAGAIMLLAFPIAAQAQLSTTARPTGGAVVAGQASIGQTTAQTTVVQGSQRAAIDWRSYDIGSSHTVVYQQPNSSSLVLNRVTGGNPSQIAGRIQANGQVAIVNGSGVVFMNGSQVDVQSLIVSSANISNRNLMAGKLVFDQPGRPDAKISNAGTITVKGTGLAALVAPQVANSGVINARMGHVVLAGGEAHTVDLYGDGLMSVDVTKQVRKAPDGSTVLVTNSGTINADGGTIQLTARAADGIVTNLVSNTGRLRANSVGDKTGTIVMSAVGGSISVEGQVQAEGRAAGTTGGTVQLAATNTVALGATARVSASGHAGGGTVAIGTTVARARAQGGGVPDGSARVVTVAPGARIAANARQSGNGGTVAILSTENTAMGGAISARGGRAGGDGGNAEISGRAGYALTGTVDVSAPAGKLGNILIDPYDLTIVHGTAGSGANDLNTGAGVVGVGDGGTTPTDNYTVTDGKINSFLGNVTLQTTHDLVVSDNVTINLNLGNQLPVNPVTQSLVLQAGNNLTVNPTASITTTGSVILTAANTVTLASSGGVGPTLSAGDSVILYGINGVTANGNLTGGTSGFVSLLGSQITVGAGAQLNAGRIDMAIVAGPADNIVGAPVTVGTNVLIDSTAVLGAPSLRLGIAREPLTNVDSPAATSITLDAPLSLAGKTLNLQTTGAVSQSAAGVVTAGTLIGQVTGTADLTVATNAVAALGGFSGGSLLLNNGSAALSISGAVTVGGTVNLIGGAISETSTGSLAAGTLTGTITGTANLGSSVNAVAQIGTFSSTDDFTLNNGSTNVAIVGQLTASGKTVRLDAGTISESAAGGITAATLTGSSTGDVALAGAVNAVGSLGTFTFAGNFGLNDGTQALTLLNPLNAGTTGTVLLNAGSLTQSSAGVITAAVLTGSTVNGTDLSGATNVVLNLGPFGTGSAGFKLNNDTSKALTVTGAVGNAAGPVVLTTGQVAETGTGSILASTLSGSSSSSVNLGAGTNAVGNLGAYSVGGDLALSNGSTALNIASAIAAAGHTVTLNAGSLTQAASAGITADTLAGSTAGVANLGTATNAVAKLGAFSSGGAFTLQNGTTALSVTGAVSAGSNTVTLNAGPLSETATGGITAGTLTGSSSGSVALGAGTNAVATLGALPFTGNFALNNGTTGLMIASPINAGTGTVTLNAASLAQSGTAPITAGTLSGSTILVADLTGATNAIARIGGFTSGSDFALQNGSTGLTITGALSAANHTVTLAAGPLAETTGSITAGTLQGSSTGAITLGSANAIGALGSLSASGDLFVNNPGLALQLSGPVNAGSHTVTLNAGSLSQDAAGVITAGTLTGTVGGSVDLGAAQNAVTSLGVFGFNGNFAFNDGTRALALANPLNAGGNTVTLIAGSLSQSSAAVITAGTLSGSTGGAADLSGATNAISAVSGFTSGGNFTLKDGTTALVISGPLNAGANTVTLNAGPLSDTAAGVITAGTLQGSSTGTVMLGAAPNAVTNLGVLSFNGGFAFNDGTQALTLVNPINAGSSTVSLSAGSLAQSGSAKITAGLLSGGTLGGDANLGTAVNAVASVGGFNAAGNFTLNNGTTPLLVSGALSAPGHTVSLTSGALSDNASGVITAGTLQANVTGTVSLGVAQNAVSRLGAISSSGDFTFNDGTTALTIVSALNAPGRVVTLTAGSLAQTAAITAGTLTGSTTGAVDLGTVTNTVTTLGPFTSGGDFTLNNGGTALTVNGALNAGTHTVTLATGALGEGANGSITAGVLSGTSTGSVSLTGPNAISALGNYSFNGNFTLNDGTTALNLVNPLNAGNATVSLTTGALTQTSAGVITAGLLTGTSSGSVDLSTAANNVGTLGSYTFNGNFAFNDGSHALLLNNPLNAGSNGVTLIAGSIEQFAGATITAGLLSGSTTGAAYFGGAPNAVAKIGDFTSGGAFTLANGSNPVSIAGTLDATGQTVALYTGAVSESGGTIKAGTLTGTSSGSVDLGTSVNAVTNLGTYTFNGGFALNDGALALTLVNPINAGPTGTVLLSAGSLLESAGGTITAGLLTGGTTGNAIFGNANAVGSVSGFTANGFTLNNGGNALQIGSGGLTASGTATLTAASLSQTGVLTAGTLAGSTTGAVDLGTAANVVNNLGTFAAGGNFTLNNGGTAVSVTGALSTPGTLSLTAGSLGQGSGGSVAAQTLTGSTTGATSLTGSGNAIAAVGTYTAGGSFALNDGPTALTLSGPLTVSGGTVSLNAGSIVETGGTVTAQLLTGSTSAGAATFGGGNAVDTVGPFTTAGNFLLNDGSANLLVVGGLNAGSAAVTLNAGTLSQTAAGVITAQLLAGSTSGATDLSAATNAVNTLGPFTTGGNFSLNDGSTITLTLVGPVNVGSNTAFFQAGNLTQNANGKLTAGTLTGNVTDSVDLTAATNAVTTVGTFTFGNNFALNNGDIDTVISSPLYAPGKSVSFYAGSLTQTAAGVITAGKLSGSTTRQTDLGTAVNAIDTLGSFTSGGNFTLNDGTTALTLLGPLNAGANTVSLTAGSLGQGSTGAVLTAGTLVGSVNGAVNLGTAANAVSNLGLFTVGGNFTLNDGTTALTMSAPLNAGTNTVTLNAGSLTQTGSAMLTAGVLSGSTVGDANLTGAVNAVSAIGTFSAGGNFSLNNGTTPLSFAGALLTNGLAVTAGSLTETAGASVTAGSLSGSTSGGVNLTGGTNAIATLGPFTSGGDFVLPDGSAALVLTGALNAGGNNVVLSAGSLSQMAAGTITAGTLSGSAQSVQLTGANQVGTLGSLQASGGDLLFTNAQALTVTGQVGAATSGPAGGHVSLDTGANALTVTGGAVVGAQTGVTLSGSSLLQNGASLINGPAVTVNAPLVQDGGRLVGGTVTISGAVTQNAGTIWSGSDLAAAAPLVNGTIASHGNLTLVGVGSVTGNVLSDNSIVIRAPSGAVLSLSGNVTAGLDLSVTQGTVPAAGPAGSVVPGTTGGIVQSGGTLFAGRNATLYAVDGAATQSGGTLAAGTGATVVALGGDNSFSVSQQAAISRAVGVPVSYACPGCSISIDPGSPGPLTGTVSIAQPAFLRLDGVTLTLANPEAANTMTLHSTGATTATGTLVAGTLNGTAGYAASGFDAAGLPVYGVLDGTTAGAGGAALTAASNGILRLGSYQALGGFTLVDAPVGGGLTVAGTVRAGLASDPLTATAAHAQPVSITVAQNGVAGSQGNLVIDGSTGGLLAGSAVTLATAGSLAEANGGSLVAATLSGSASSVALTTSTAGSPLVPQVGNQVATLGALSATNGDLVLVNSRNLAVTGPVSASGALTLTAQGGTGTPSAAEGQAAGNLSFAPGLQAGTNATLTANGTLSGNGITVGQTLSLTAGADVAVDGISATTLTGMAGGNFQARGGYGRAVSTSAVTGSLDLSDSQAVVLDGVSWIGGSALVTAAGITSVGQLAAGSDIRLHSTDGFTQGAGQIAAGGLLLVSGSTDVLPLAGSVLQSGGVMAGGAGLRVLSTGDALQTGGAVLSPVVQVASFAGTNTFGASNGATVAVQPGSVVTTGVLPVFSIPQQTATVAIGARPVTVRLDGATVSPVRAVAADTVELHAGATLAQPAGGVQATTLTGTAGYAVNGTDALGLPTYGTADGGQPGITSATLNGANNILRLGNFQARYGLVLADAPADQTSSTGAAIAAGGLVIGGTVRSGLATDPLTGAAADASGAPLSITLSGTAGQLVIGDASAPGAVLAGGLVTLNVPGSISQAPGSLLVAGTLTGSAAGVALNATAGNQVVRLGAFGTAGDFSLVNGRDLSVTGAVVAGANPPVGTTPTIGLTTFGNLDLNGGSLTAGTVTLVTTGAATESNGFIVANVLNNSAASTSFGSGSNRFAQLGAISSPGGITVADTGNLVITGPLTATGGDIGVSATGNLVTQGSVTAGGRVGLTAGGTLTDLAGSTVNGGSVALSSVGAATLSGSTASGGALSIGSQAAVVLAAGSSTTAGSTLGLTAGTDLTLAGAASATGGITVVAGGNIGLTGGLTGRDFISLTATGGTLNQAGVVAATTGLAFASGQGMNLSGRTSAGGSVALAAGGGLTFVGGSTTTAGTTLSATAGASETVAGTVTAGGTVALTAAADLTLSNTVTSTGDAVVLSATSGALNQAGTVKAGTALITHSGQGTILTGQLTSGTGVSLTSGSDLLVSGGGVLQAGTTLTGTAGGVTTVAGTAGAGGAVSLSSQGGVAITGALSSGDAVRIDAGSGALAESGSITAMQGITTGSGQGSTFGGNTSGSTLSAVAGGTLLLSGTETFGGAINATAGGDLTVSNTLLSQSGAIALAANGGTLTLGGTITAGTLLNGVSAQGTVLTGQTMAGTSLGLTAGTGLTFAAGSSTTAGGALNAVAKGGATVAGSVVSTDALSIGANGLTVSGPVQSRSAGLTLDGGSGDFLLTGAGSLTGSTLLVRSSGSNTLLGTTNISGTTQFIGNGLTLGNTIVGGAIDLGAGSGPLLLTAGGSITATTLTISTTDSTTLNGTVSASGDVTIGSTGLVLGGTLTSTGGNIQLNGGNGTLTQTGTIGAGGALSMSSGGLATLTGTESAGGTVSLKSNGATLGGSLVSRGDAVRIDAGSGTLVSSGTVNASTALTLTSGALTLAAGSTTAAGTSLTATAGGGAVLAGTVVATGPVSLTANGIGIGGSVTSRGDAISLNAGGGAITQGGTVSAATALSEQAAQSIGLAGRTSAGTISLVSKGGDVTFDTASSTTAGRSLLATAAGTARLSGSETAPLMVVTAPGILLQGGTITVGGTAQPSGIKAPALPGVDTAQVGAFFEARSTFQQTGGLSVVSLGGGESTVRIDLTSGTGTMSFSGLSAPNTDLILNLGNGSALGQQINVKNLDIQYTGLGFGGGTLDLTNVQIGGQTGTAASAAALVFPAPSRDYRINACAAASVNCVVLRPQAVPVGNPLKELTLSFFSDQDDDRDLLVPNISDQGL